MPYDEDWDLVMAKYDGYCVYPYCFGRADTVHEEPPRSMQKMVFEDRYPLCRAHHEEVQKMPRETALETVQRGASLVLSLRGDPMHPA